MQVLGKGVYFYKFINVPTKKNLIGWLDVSLVDMQALDLSRYFEITLRSYQMFSQLL